jgi:DNA helicase-2/ATP-dependent DNA helicase PcrA
LCGGLLGRAFGLPHGSRAAEALGAMASILDRLNPAQREAASYLDGPLMIVAGAGSGKTRVITHRIAFLVREVGVPLQQILAVTFTNKAAREMRDRVARLLGEEDIPGLAIGTFHSRCARLLRIEAEAAELDPNFTILDESDALQAMKQSLRDLGIPERRLRPSLALHNVLNFKMRLLLIEDVEADPELNRDAPFGEIYRAYQGILKKNKSVDMEDLIFRTVLLFRDHDDVRRKWATRYRFVLVDEFQDTNHGQFLLTNHLAKDHRNICVVGDEDQAIYSWRGADITNLLDFQKAFPGAKVVRLEQNYRSTATILRAAAATIERNVHRLGKKLFTESGEGTPLGFLVGEDDREEARVVALQVQQLLRNDGVPPQEIAVFYRTHRLSRAVEDAMRELRIPYRIVGGVRFYDRAEIKDLLCFLRLAVNPYDDIAFLRVVNVPARGLGKATIEALQASAANGNLSLHEAAWRAVEGSGAALHARAKSALYSFLNLVHEWGEAARSARAVEVLDRVLADTDYLERGLGDADSIEAAARKENIEEFHSVCALHEPEGDGPPLAQFLRDLSLDAAMKADEGAEAVSLLTIHNAKGLEYDCVFVVGLEDGVFPNSRAMQEADLVGIEEERRLFYVALTRARRRLWLSRSRRRAGYSGGYEQSEPSRFLAELPPDVFDEASRFRLARELPYGWGQEDRSGNRPSASGALRGERTFVRNTAPLPAPIAGGFRSGQRVKHQYLGQGTVIRAYGPASSQRVVVAFDSGREHDLIARHAPMVVVE